MAVVIRAPLRSPLGAGSVGMRSGEWGGWVLVRLRSGEWSYLVQDWGRLDEAMALHQKKEKICEELGDRAGLGASYGNQATILRQKGQLDEAMVLIRKREAICVELGDRAGLARCYWSWGLTARLQKDYAASKQKLQQALAMFTELGMPRERDAVKADLEEGDAAAG